jgi:dihydrodipicolinate synthase/N-acetylneuraminate lyase
MRMGEFGEAAHFYSQAINAVDTNAILYNNRSIANVRADIDTCHFTSSV